MNKFRALLIGFAASVGAGGIAAYNGVFDGPPPAEMVKAPVADTAKPDAAKIEMPKAEPAPAAEIAKVDPGVTEPSKTTESPVGTDPAPVVTAAEPVAVTAPTFDVLRVEPDGSVLIAGKAGENAQVEVLSGADILGATKAEANGDFAITLSIPLKPGDYQLVLRATGTDGKSANSAETATVSVPEQKDGPVLALVEEAGKPSRIITAPEKPVETAQAAEEPKPAATAEVQVSGEVKAPETPAAVAAETVTIEAVEIENGKIFVAGSAKGVATVRIYANDEVLGDAKREQGDRFLAEFQKELAPGDYIFKAEGLAADGVTVISRASVPFQRQADVAEVAPAPAAETGTADTTKVETTSAPAEAPKPKAVIIRRGDTLWQISRRIYGRGVRYSTIYLANQGVTANPNMIFPGQVFTVPEKTPEGDAADAVEIEKRAAPLTPAEQ